MKANYGKAQNRESYMERDETLTKKLERMSSKRVLKETKRNGYRIQDKG